jgi:uncharacterized membrane protein YoaK (UPF0700 family)
MTDQDPAHGPLPALLLLLTVETGVVDAVSILALGRVFVANMTGNVVFLGFAVVGAAGFSFVASAAALVGFLAGAYAGGRFVGWFGRHRGRLLRNTTAVELLLVAVALVVAALVHVVPGSAAAVAVAALLALAMGMQNTMARKLAVPDLTTTVLTMTLTGIAAEIRTSPRGTIARRVLAVVAMFAGAAVGAVLVLQTGVAPALVLAALLLAVVALGATLLSRRPAAWQTHGV